MKEYITLHRDHATLKQLPKDKFPLDFEILDGHDPEEQARAEYERRGWVDDGQPIRYMGGVGIDWRFVINLFREGLKASEVLALASISKATLDTHARIAFGLSAIDFGELQKQHYTTKLRRKLNEMAFDLNDSKVAIKLADHHLGMKDVGSDETEKKPTEIMISFAQLKEKRKEETNNEK